MGYPEDMGSDAAVKHMKRISLKNVLQNALIIFSVLLFSFVAYLVLSGTKAFAVQTDSMSPIFQRGSVVFVKPAEFGELQTGDIVSVKFADGSGVFTHRITKIDKKNRLISTKGDSNNSEDPEQSKAGQIVGKYWFSLPAAGFLALNIKSNTVIYFLIAVAAALFITRIIIGAKNKAYG